MLENDRHDKRKTQHRKGTTKERKTHSKLGCYTIYIKMRCISLNWF